MNKFKKTFNTLKYAIPFAFASFLTQGIKGQDPIIWKRSFPLPTEPINLFISQDSTPQALEYNALTTKAARDAVMPGKVTSDITAKVMGPTWSCNKAIALYVLDSKNFGKDIYDSDKLIYDGYDGDNIEDILLHGGTRKYFGTLGIPAGGVELSDVLHGTNYVITGNKITEASSYNFMEVPPPFNATNVQPGQIYIPMNENSFMIYYTYIYKSAEHDKNIANIPVVLFKIVNGEYIFQGTNPYVKLIMERDTIPPIIQMDSPVDGKTYDSNYVRFKGSIIDDNFRYAYCSFDGGITKIPMKDKIDEEKLLTNGSYTAIFYAKDEFWQDTEKIINFIVNRPPLEETILYPNPVLDQLNIKYKSGMSNNAYRETYSIDGRLMDRKQIGSEMEEILNMAEYKRGIYIIRITDGKERQNLKFIKE